MFPRLRRKFVILYTLSTGLIMTFVLSAAFLFYVSSQENRQQSAFQELLFTLTAQLQTDSRFADSFLVQMEKNNRLLIYIEENDTPFFFPGAYKSRTKRDILFSRAEDAARKENIYSDSHPISSNLLQSSVFRIDGEERDTYLGNVLILRAASGYKKLILLQDISDSQNKLLETGCVYLLIDLSGILLLFLSGRWFVGRSLKPLEETYQKQQEFVAAVSHELRSPFAVIQTTAEAALSNPSEHGHGMSVIQKECRRGSTLIKNLLLLVTADQKEWAVREREFEIDELLLNLLELYEPILISKGGTLSLLLPDEPLPPVSADPDLCQQIFTILLDNAIAYALTDESCANEENEEACACTQSQMCMQAMPARLAARGNKRQIILQAEVSLGCFIVRVIDHGPGIPDEEKARIFDRFYRSDRSRSKKEHFGLGLSIATALAGIQNLDLHVEDTKGGGSTFSVKFGKRKLCH